jgi:hypothetical protein
MANAGRFNRLEDFDDDMELHPEAKDNRPRGVQTLA